MTGGGERAALAVGGLLVLGAFLFLGLSEHKALGMALAIGAVLVARALYRRISGDAFGPDNDRPGPES